MEGVVPLNHVFNLGDIQQNLSDINLLGHTRFTYLQGTSILPHIGFIHSDATLWPRPEQLDVNRFLDMDGNYVKRKELSVFSIGQLNINDILSSGLPQPIQPKIVTLQGKKSHGCQKRVKTVGITILHKNFSSNFCVAVNGDIFQGPTVTLNLFVQYRMSSILWSIYSRTFSMYVIHYL